MNRILEVDPEGTAREVIVVPRRLDGDPLAERGLDFESLELAQRLRQKVWDPEGNSMNLRLYRAVELGGEAGELLNVVKKLERERLGLRGSRDTKEHLEQELGDVVICAQLLAMCYGVDLGAAVRKTFNNKSREVNIGVIIE